MQRVKDIIIALLVLALIWVWNVNAGTPAGPGTAPDSTNSYTLADIYNRLNSGTDGSQSNFMEPSVVPGTGTMHTLNEVMDKAPAKDDTSGAITTNVLTGTTFWGLNAAASEWGLQTGTMTDTGAVIYTPQTVTQTVAAGYHNGEGKVIGDEDLTADKIKKDVELFGVTGTYGGVVTYEAGVLKTGLTKCYDASHAEVDCPVADRPGQDGDHQAEVGVALSEPRFTDNSNGTVTDNLTGLIWLKNAYCANARRDWAAALADIQELNANGTMNGHNCGDTSNGNSHQIDWRLPNIRELQSLINYKYAGPALSDTAGTAQWREGYPFNNIQSSSYWSNTTVQGDLKSSWYIVLDRGRVLSTEKSNDDKYVWAVRGGK